MDCSYQGYRLWVYCRGISVKLFKEIWNKINDFIDDVAAQLGLQPRPVPARVKKNEDRETK